MSIQEHTSEFLLWRAVVRQVVMDLGSRDQQVRWGAERWFSATDDMIVVCGHADVSPHDMQECYAIWSNLPQHQAKVFRHLWWKALDKFHALPTRARMSRIVAERVLDSGIRTLRKHTRLDAPK